MGVQYLADSLRSECQGRIKVSTVKPTGFQRTGLMGTVINQMAGSSIISDLIKVGDQYDNMASRADYHDINSITYCDPDPQILADNIVYLIDQPWGVNVSDITVRAAGDLYNI